MQPEFSRAAEADIYEIWFFLAQDSLASADRVLSGIRAACERASDLPHAGSIKLQFTRLPVRFNVVRPFPYFVIYDPARTPVRILRIIHTSRDITRELEDLYL